MVVTSQLKPRPKRGSRAFTDSEEWAIYGRIVLGGERIEALAVEYDVTGRTISNVIRRRTAAKTNDKTLAVTADEGLTTSPERSERTPIPDDSTSDLSAQEGASSLTEEV